VGQLNICENTFKYIYIYIFLVNGRRRARIHLRAAQIFVGLFTPVDVMATFIIVAELLRSSTFWPCAIGF
jgi:hypothetical protein